MLQVICSCGRIAEVRHRSNGKHLAFIHCVNKCGGLVSTKQAAKIEAAAKEDIGVKGEFPNNSSKTNGDKQDKHFKPAAEDLPENLEPNLENSKTDLESENGAKSEPRGNGLKILFGVLTAAFLGGGAYHYHKSQG